MLKSLALAAALVAAPLTALAAGKPIAVVAAENFYGEVATAIGGDHVRVTTILSNPDADPHDYEATPSTARAVADAAIVVYSGIDYDPWMDKLLAASPRPQREAISVASLLGRKPGDNPHVWYDPAAMPALADALAATLAKADPANAASYASRAKSFAASLDAMNQKVAAIKARYGGVPVTATEPVFGYMAEALGLAMRNEGFQTAIMNDTEPSASDVAAMEDDLKGGKVKVLFYNSQVTDSLTKHLLDLAHAGNVPVVGVTETEPPGKSYVGWMTEQLDATAKALAGPSS